MNRIAWLILLMLSVCLPSRADVSEFLPLLECPDMSVGTWVDTDDSTQTFSLAKSTDGTIVYKAFNNTELLSEDTARPTADGYTILRGHLKIVFSKERDDATTGMSDWLVKSYRQEGEENSWVAGSQAWTMSIENAAGRCRVLGRYDSKHAREVLAEFEDGVLSLGNGTGSRRFRKGKPGEKPTPEDVRRWEKTRSAGNFYLLWMAVKQYALDKHKMPPLDNPETARSALLEYVTLSQYFIHPASGKPYLANANLSRKPWADIKNQAQVPLFFEPVPSPDGSRYGVFLDGLIWSKPASFWQPFLSQTSTRKPSPTPGKQAAGKYPFPGKQWTLYKLGITYGIRYSWELPFREKKTLWLYGQPGTKVELGGNELIILNTGEAPASANAQIRFWCSPSATLQYNPAIERPSDRAYTSKKGAGGSQLIVSYPPAGLKTSGQLIPDNRVMRIDTGIDGYDMFGRPKSTYFWLASADGSEDGSIFHLVMPQDAKKGSTYSVYCTVGDGKMWGYTFPALYKVLVQ